MVPIPRQFRADATEGARFLRVEFPNIVVFLGNIDSEIVMRIRAECHCGLRIELCDANTGGQPAGAATTENTEADILAECEIEHHVLFTRCSLRIVEHAT